MAHKEYGVTDILDIIRRAQAGDSIRRIAKATGMDRKTIGNYLRIAAEHGFAAGVAEDQLADSASAVFRTVHAPQLNRPTPIYTVSVDEKPGVQAIWLTAPDLPPVPGKESSVARDYEYVRRHGTLSILAALDLHTGEIIANVEPRHRSCEFIDLLKRLDAHYPAEAIIRVVVDNHSAHISKETMKFEPEKQKPLNLLPH